ncbi:MAG TPA: AAA family ATPase, partial [Kofleriaceae bacterium]|nr:AAA family ATPase [Kofleriaceae bacterium]
MEGIVLVDELDLHLHPTWQTEIVAGLKATFPRMQFIVTTHSPLVLAGCRADEVWRLKQDEASG